MRGHGGEHLPVQRLRRAQSHLWDGHGSRMARRQQSMTRARGGEERKKQDKYINKLPSSRAGEAATVSLPQTSALAVVRSPAGGGGIKRLLRREELAFTPS